MPITKSAKKAVRVAERRKKFNDRRRKTMRETMKKTEALAQKGALSEATELLPRAYKAIDKAAKRGVIKKNTAARKKSRIARMLKQEK